MYLMLQKKEWCIPGQKKLSKYSTY